MRFQREGEPTQQEIVISGGGRRAMIVAVTMPLQREVLQVGDRLTVLDPSAEIPHRAD